MKKYFYKDSEGNIKSFSSKVDPSLLLPEGAELIDAPSEDLQSGDYKGLLTESEGSVDLDLEKVRSKKVEELRAERDEKMLENDKQYLIALKDGADTTAILAERTTLLDVPQTAQTDLAALTTLEDIEAYSPF